MITRYTRSIQSGKRRRRRRCGTAARVAFSAPTASPVAAGCASTAPDAEGLFDETTVDPGPVALPAQTVNGSVAAISSEENASNASDSVAKIIAGDVAGVEPISARRGGQLSVCGIQSFIGAKQPLYVIERLPVNGSPIGTNPKVAGSVTALKTPTLHVLSGIRGGNGVIVVETKDRALGPATARLRASRTHP